MGVARGWSSSRSTLCPRERRVSQVRGLGLQMLRSSAGPVDSFLDESFSPGHRRKAVYDPFEDYQHLTDGLSGSSPERSAESRGSTNTPVPLSPELGQRHSYHTGSATHGTLMDFDLSKFRCALRTGRHEGTPSGDPSWANKITSCLNESRTPDTGAESNLRTTSCLVPGIKRSNATSLGKSDSTAEGPTAMATAIGSPHLSALVGSEPKEA